MLPFNVWAQSLWETLYMVIVSTVISYAIGLPLGLTLVVTDKGGIRPMPVVNAVLGVVVNILRSVPFLILAVMITPITRAIVGKASAPPHDRSADVCRRAVCGPYGRVLHQGGAVRCD